MRDLYGVIVEVDTREAQKDQGIEATLEKLQDEIVPQIAQQEGFEQGWWTMPNQETQQGFAFVLFSDENHAKHILQQFPVGNTVQPGVKVTRSELTQVAIGADSRIPAETYQLRTHRSSRH